jgi:hypothetical protein
MFIVFFLLLFLGTAALIAFLLGWPTRKNSVRQR